MSDIGVDAAGVKLKRIGLRVTASAGKSASSSGAPGQSLDFHIGADMHGTDRDILFGYQVFLGRDPENSFVIAEAKAGPLAGFLRGLLGSGEFQNAVGQPLLRGATMPHERSASGPSTEQVDWLLERLVLPRDIVANLRAAHDWRLFWTVLAETGLFSLTARPKPQAPQAPGNIVATTPEGGFVLITIDQPQPGVKLHPGGTISGSGWVIAPSDIIDVTIHLDDQLLTHARYGLPRPDVARNFPHYRHVDHCGFAFSAAIPPDAKILRGSELVVGIRTEADHTGRRGLRVEPPATTASTAETWLIRLFVEDVRVDPEGALRLRGWAISRAKLATIAVYLGDTRLGTAEYGLSRPDIAASHADYPNAADSGFAFAASLAGHTPGPAAIRVEATDLAGNRRQAIVPVTIPAASKSGAGQGTMAGATKLVCDAARLSPTGKLGVGGWVLADSPVTRLVVSAHGKSLGEAQLGQKRPDLARRFPDQADSGSAGFRFTGQITAGSLTVGDSVTLTAQLRDGGSQSIEARLEAGELAAKAGPAPEVVRLELDRPAIKSGRATAPVRGALTIAGWTTAPDGIERVTVACDDAPLGEAYFGMRREDIARAYPYHEGALRAGFAMVLPPGAVPEGTRRFTVTAHGKDGAGTATASFEVEIEAPESILPGSQPRGFVPRAEAAFTRAILTARGVTPRFAVLVRSAGAKAVALSATLESLAAQAYQDFEVTVSVSAAKAVAQVAGLAQAAGLAGRVTAVPAGAVPKRAAPADLTMVLEAGDTLSADALLELAAAHAINRDAGFIYADEYRLDPVQGRPAPLFKPEFSAELLLATNYIGRPWCVPAATIARAGLTDAALLSGSFYGLVLRLTEAAGSVHHIPRVLAAAGGAEAAAAERDALAAAAARRGITATVEPGRAPGIWRLRRAIETPGLVSVIIPTAGRGSLIRQAIQTLRESAGRAIEIVVLDNIPASNKAMKTWVRRNADQVLEMRGSFNWSRFNNEGAAAAKGDYLLFLNDDIEARQPGWLDALLEYAQLDGVAVTGARLLYPDGKVQHAGQYLADGHARHAFRFADGTDPGPFGLAMAAREMASVTGACQLVRRDVFDRLGGFDEAHDVVNNDLDFCLRAQRAGLAVIFTPHAELMHHELASRAALEDSYDEARFTGEWRLRMLRGDIWRSPRLLADSDQYAAEPEPVLTVHAGPNGPDAAAVRRILAVKLDHIGDFLTARPALAALRAAFPDAAITLLAPPATAVLARGMAEIDAVIEFSFFHARSADGQVPLGAGELEALAARLLPHRFDLAIDLRMQPETREVLRHTGATFLAGYDHAGRFPWLHIALEWEGDLRLLAKHAHVSERLCQLIGTIAGACRPVAAVRPMAVRPAAAVPALARLGPDFLSKQLVCVHAGVGNPVRQWPASHFAALIDLLADEYDLNAILVGGGEEQAVATDVMSRVTAKDRVVSLVGAVKLADLGNVMAACALFVGNNSGPKHLAASLGVPTVGVHSAVVDAGEWAPVGGNAVALQRKVLCGPCYLEFASDCPRAMACLTGLRPRDVLAACRRALALRPAAAPPQVARRSAKARIKAK